MTDTLRAHRRAARAVADVLELVEGPGQSLALALAGRTSLLGDVTGDGAAELTRRLG